MFVEPPQTHYDLRFRLFGIPVRVHPFFWLTTLMMGYRLREPTLMLIWVGVVFVSILIHELGHAFAALWYGWPPRITLHGFGGLASYRPTHHDMRSQIIISAAGPGAGFLFIALVMAVVHATGHPVSIDLSRSIQDWVLYEPAFESRNLNVMFSQLLWVNIFWGLINLLPIYPLDGGHIAQELMMRADAGDGFQKSLWLSIFTAIGAAVFCGVKFRDAYMAIFFGYLAYIGYATLQNMRGRGGGYGPW
jgi:Zn-dependent protease